MSRPRSGRPPDLIATIAAAVLAVLVALLVDSGPLATVALAPLVLLLPGYALTAVLFPPGKIDRGLRISLVFALSVGVTALSGLVLQVFVDLSRGIVTASLAMITIGAALAALRRRDAPETDAPPASARAPLPLLPAGLAIVVAVAIAGVAIEIASDGARDHLNRAHFSSLWLLPQGEPGVPPNGPPVTVGVSNEEGRDTAYLVRVGSGTSTIGEWRFRLAPGEQWEIPLPATDLQESGRLVARLDRKGERYRVVALELDLPADGGGDG